MAARAKRKRSGARVFYSDRNGIFGEQGFSSCAKAKAYLKRTPPYPGVRARVVCGR